MKTSGTHAGTVAKLLLGIVLALGTTAVALPCDQTAYAMDGSQLRLTDGEAAEMERLRPQCLDVSYGNRTSTVFDFNPAVLLGKEYLTTEDFGIESGEVDPSCHDAMATFLTSETNTECSNRMLRVADALFLTSPSAMEWSAFGGYADATVSLDIREVDGQLRAYLPSTGEFALSPAPYFKAGGNSRREVDPARTAIIRDSIAVAQGIVDRHAGEDAYTRVNSYANELYALFTDGSGSDYYTDGLPWCFSSLFDGDPSTGSVCVGYSQAYTLLNELSGASDMQVMSVFGTLTGLKGEIAHAWNITRMPNGETYLSDLGNNHPEYQGGGLLLLAGAPGSPSTSYAFDAHGIRLTYAYSDETRSIVSEAALGLSPSPYAPPVAQSADEEHADGPNIATAAIPATDTRAPQPEESGEAPAPQVGGEGEKGWEPQTIALPDKPHEAINLGDDDLSAADAAAPTPGWIAPAAASVSVSAAALTAALAARRRHRESRAMANAYRRLATSR